MSKTDLLKALKPKQEEIEVNGMTVAISGLTVGQRKKFYDASKEDLFHAQALVVCMGCAEFTEDDVEEVLQLDSQSITELADAILKKSGLSDDEDEEKNS